MEIRMLPNEFWFGGDTESGLCAPFGAESRYEADYRLGAPNQSMPFFLSTEGRYIFSDTPFGVKIGDGVIRTEGGEVSLTVAGNCLRDAYLDAVRRHFPFEDRALPEIFFTAPQYNTWMQFTYDPTEEGVLRYAQDILDNGFRPGVLIIDEGWHGRYGLWEFDAAKFPHPKEMVEKLHAMGFRVMLWVVPWITADGRDFAELTQSAFNPNAARQLLRNKNGRPAMMLWWNGVSCMYDLTNPLDAAVLDGKLRRLTEEYGVDGFKFDGGAVAMMHGDWLLNPPYDDSRTPEERNRAWNEFGARFDYHEFKDTYGLGGRAMIQRLRDREHSFGPRGVASLVPAALVASLIGYPYICPDMVGGGEWTYRTIRADRFDAEVFVRMAEASALFPMMQFSWAPWEALGESDLAIVKKMAALHVRMGETMLSLVRNTRKTGEPIMRLLEYNYPHAGYAAVTDEFMLGEDILVAPVTEKGATSRTVVLPARFRDENTGKIFEAGTYTIPADRGTLPWFTRVRGRA